MSIVSEEFCKLFIFKYNLELPINFELNEMKIQIKELQLLKISNQPQSDHDVHARKLIILNEDKNDEYKEVD